MKREDDQNLEEPDKKIEEMHRDDMDMGTQNSRVGARYVLEEERRVLTFYFFATLFSPARVLFVLRVAAKNRRRGARLLS